MKELRLSAPQRITGVIWGLIVTGAAITAMVALSGTDIDIVYVIIAALVALGTWLLASALAAIRPRKASPDAVAARADGDTTFGDEAATEAATEAAVTEELGGDSADDQPPR